MAKAKTAYVCAECGAEHSKWQGQCAECGAWNTLCEFVVQPATAAAANPRGSYAGNARRARRSRRSRQSRRTPSGATRPASASSIACSAAGSSRVSVVLIGGDPGIGKSTLLLQMLGALGAARARLVRHRRGKSRAGRCARAAARHRARRARSARRNLDRAHPRRSRATASPTCSSSIRSRPIWTELLTAAPGSVSQVRESRGAARALREGNRHQRVPGRPRHQGRRHRRPARARAHGRRGAVFRRRSRQPASACCARSRTASARSTSSACSR